MDNTRLTTTAFNLHRDPVPAFCAALAREVRRARRPIYRTHFSKTSSRAT